MCELCEGRGWYVERASWSRIGGSVVSGLPPRAVGCWACGEGTPCVDAPVPGNQAEGARAMGAQAIMLTTGLHVFDRLPESMAGGRLQEALTLAQQPITVYALADGLGLSVPRTRACVREWVVRGLMVDQGRHGRSRRYQAAETAP